MVMDDEQGGISNSKQHVNGPNITTNSRVPHCIKKQSKTNKSPSCCPCITIGCNQNWKFDSFLYDHCPFVACCGEIEPLDGSEYTPYCPNRSSTKFISGFGRPMVEEVRCVCGCCLSTPICFALYFPCCLLSYCLPRGWINVGPCCWWGCDQYGGRGYYREEWYVDDL